MSQYISDIMVNPLKPAIWWWTTSYQESMINCDDNQLFNSTLFGIVYSFVLKHLSLTHLSFLCPWYLQNMKFMKMKPCVVWDLSPPVFFCTSSVYFLYKSGEGQRWQRSASSPLKCPRRSALFPLCSGCFQLNTWNTAELINVTFLSSTNRNQEGVGLIRAMPMICKFYKM